MSRMWRKNGGQMKLLQLISNIVYILLVLVWLVIFFYDRTMASDILPVVLVLSFVNINSRIDEIIKQLKELGK